MTSTHGNTTSINRRELKLDLTKDYYSDIRKEMLTLRPKQCPHCGGEHFRIFANYKGMKRYKCYSCGRTFLPTTGTTIHYINERNKFIIYLNIIKTEGLLSLHEMCSRLGICIQTAFDWRHKLILSLVKKKILLRGDLYFYELGMNYSLKGRRGIDSKDIEKYKKKHRAKVKVCTLTNEEKLRIKIARVGKELKSSDIDRTIGESIRKGSSIVCLDAKKFRGIKSEKVLRVTKVNVKRKPSSVSIRYNRILEVIKCFKVYIGTKFRGVATKYLQLYSSYYVYFEKFRLFSDYKILLSDISVWFTYISIERYYKKFLNKYSVIPYISPVKRRWKTQNDVSVFNIF